MCHLMGLLWQVVGSFHREIYNYPLSKIFLNFCFNAEITKETQLLGAEG